MRHQNITGSEGGQIHRHHPETTSRRRTVRVPESRRAQTTESRQARYQETGLRIDADVTYSAMLKPHGKHMGPRLYVRRQRLKGEGGSHGPYASLMCIAPALSSCLSARPGPTAVSSTMTTADGEATARRLWRSALAPAAVWSPSTRRMSHLSGSEGIRTKQTGRRKQKDPEGFRLTQIDSGRLRRTKKDSEGLRRTRRPPRGGLT